MFHCLIWYKFLIMTNIYIGIMVCIFRAYFNTLYTGTTQVIIDLCNPGPYQTGSFFKSSSGKIIVHLVLKYFFYSTPYTYTILFRTTLWRGKHLSCLLKIASSHSTSIAHFIKPYRDPVHL